MNIKRNNFWSAAKAIAASLLFGISIGNAQFDVFITEIADPSNAGPSGRFVDYITVQMPISMQKITV